MSTLRTRIGVALIAVTAAFATVSVGTANAEVDRGVCNDHARVEL
jgi:hypothetical protein